MKLDGGAITTLVRDRWPAPSLHGFWFDADTPTLVNRVFSPSSSSEVAIHDSIYRRDVGATTVTDLSWPYTIAEGRPGPTETITRSSSNSAVIIPDPTDVTKWLWQSNGTATITLSCASRTLNATVTCSTGGAATVDTWLRYATGSLRAALIAAVDNRIAGKSAATALAIFASQDHAGAVYTRNGSCWAADLDLTPISPWNSDGGATKAGVLISPRHILFAQHYPISAGSTIRFITSANVVVTRTISAVQAITNEAEYYPDLVVGKLDSDVPGSIAFAKILPTSWSAKIPVSVAGIPTLTLDQEEKAIVTDLLVMSCDAAPYFGAMVEYTIPNDGTRASFYEDKVGGDSGNPAFLIIETSLVLLNIWTFGGHGFGANIAYHKTAINTAMTTLGGGYQLTEADLSSYPSY